MKNIFRPLRIVSFALAGLGVWFAATPAVHADPPRHARSHGSYNRNDHNRRNLGQNRRNDRDRDGVPNRYDRDKDGDGVRNRYDRDEDGDGVRNRYDRNNNRNDRFPGTGNRTGGFPSLSNGRRNGDRDRDGIRNRYDSTNNRNLDSDRDGTPNYRDRYPFDRNRS